jgi:hypothetical protein
VPTRAPASTMITSCQSTTPNKFPHPRKHEVVCKSAVAVAGRLQARTGLKWLQTGVDHIPGSVDLISC